MLQTSLYLPTSLHQRLLIAAREARKSVSELARELLDRGLALTEEQKLHRMYQGLQTLGGFGPKAITDASTTIDEVLYSDQTHRGGECE